MRHLMWAAALLSAASDPGPVPAAEEDDVLRFRRTPTNPMAGGYYNDHTGCTTGHRDPASPSVRRPSGSVRCVRPSGWG